MEPYRILLADDHVLFREAMRKAIGDTKGLAVVGGVDDGLELMEFLKHTRPDLIILDLTMPNLSGLEAAKEIKKLYPEVKILILSMHKSKGCLKGAFWVGVNGYLLKEDAFQDLMSAIETIRSGKEYISPRLTDQMSDMDLQQKTEERLSQAGNHSIVPDCRIPDRRRDLRPFVHFHWNFQKPPIQHQK